MRWSRRARAGATRHPPGHFYSPIPDLEAVRADDARIFDSNGDAPGIEIDLDQQLARVARLAPAAVDIPFKEEPDEVHRYHLRNGYFDQGDGVVLYSLLRTEPPSRVVEVGSGFSSALFLDALASTDTELTFVEPYPERLNRLLRDDDRARADVVERRAQDLPPSWYVDQLGPGDILFIDSSHVAKVGSDVNLLLLEVVPRLAPGVRVHIHDVFFPFEYPRRWVYEGRAWNEVYVVRALLVNNHRLSIEVFNSYLKKKARAEVAEKLPFWDANPGSSLWLRTVE